MLTDNAVLRHPHTQRPAHTHLRSNGSCIVERTFQPRSIYPEHFMSRVQLKVARGGQAPVDVGPSVLVKNDEQATPEFNSVKINCHHLVPRVGKSSESRLPFLSAHGGVIAYA